jgi:hypothetical protein
MNQSLGSPLPRQVVYLSVHTLMSDPGARLLRGVWPLRSGPFLCLERRDCGVILAPITTQRKTGRIALHPADFDGAPKRLGESYVSRDTIICAKPESVEMAAADQEYLAERPTLKETPWLIIRDRLV